MLQKEKIAFFISPIGDSDSPTRKRSDIIKESFLKPILESFNYKCIRADEIAQPGRIDIQVIDMLINSDLVIADLSDHNANVFYELAVRHAIRKPVILLIEEGQNIPFDIRTHRTIYYDMNNGPKFIMAQQEFKKQIMSIESDEFIVDSPIREVLLKREIPDDKNILREINYIVRTNSSILNDILNIIKKKNIIDTELKIVVDKFTAIKKDNSSYDYIVIGRNVVVGGRIEIYLDKVNDECILGSYTAKSDGSWEGSIKIPKEVSKGEHYLWMKDKTTNVVEKFQITIE